MPSTDNHKVNPFPVDNKAYAYNKTLVCASGHRRGSPLIAVDVGAVSRRNHTFLLLVLQRGPGYHRRGSTGAVIHTRASQGSTPTALHLLGPPLECRAEFTSAQRWERGERAVMMLEKRGGGGGPLPVAVVTASTHSLRRNDNVSAGVGGRRGNPPEGVWLPDSTRTLVFPLKRLSD